MSVDGLRGRKCEYRLRRPLRVNSFSFSWDFSFKFRLGFEIGGDEEGRGEVPRKSQ